MRTHPFHILLLEDNPHGALRILRALDGAHGRYLQAVEDQSECLAYLRRQGLYAHSPRPDLVLLDLKLDPADGWRVLHEMRREPALHGIPVIVLTALRPDEAYWAYWGRAAQACIPTLLSDGAFTRLLRHMLAQLLPLAGAAYPNEPTTQPPSHRTAIDRTHASDEVRLSPADPDCPDSTGKCTRFQ